MAVEFWTDAMEREVKRLDEMHKLYLGLHEIVLHTQDGGWNFPLYHCYNMLGDRLSKTYSSLVWRKFPYLLTDPAGDSKRLKQLVDDIGIMRLAGDVQTVISYAGQATVKLLWSRLAGKKGKPYLRRWGEKPGEFAWWEYDGTFPYAVSFYYDEEVAELYGQKKQVVRVRERFEMVEGRDEVVVTNVAYPVIYGTPDVRSPVPLALLYPENPPPDEDRLPLTYLPGYHLQNVGEGDCRSDYTPSLMSLQRSQARLSSQRDLAIFINEMPVMNIPVSCLNPDGTVDFSRFLITVRDIGQTGEECVPINFNSWTGNLNESAKQWEINEAEFYALTGLSPAIDGKSEGGQESGFARMLGLLKTSAHIDQRRLQWDSGFWEWMGTTVPQFAAHHGNTDYGEPMTRITAQWVPAIPEDADAASMRIDRGTAGGWISLKTAIGMEHPDWSPEQVEEEHDRLIAERAEARALAVPMFSLPAPMGLPGMTPPAEETPGGLPFNEEIA